MPLFSTKATSSPGGRKSPKSLYDPQIATMEGDPSAYNQSDATGFIRLSGLRLRLRAKVAETLQSKD
jgi:argininosuccinate synthase